MNDYWNDPPEHPEPPECCDEIMDVDDKGACVCSKCGKRIEPPADLDPAAFADVELPDGYLRESATTKLMHAAQNTLESRQRRGAALHAAHGSVTVVRCSCGQAQAYEDKLTGGTRKAARTLIGIFRYFHEQHGGTVTVESQNTESSRTES